MTYHDWLIWVAFATLMIGVWYIAFRWIGRREKPLRRKAFWISWILLTPLLYGGIILVILLIRSFVPSHPFDQQVWRTDREHRVEYVDDLIASEKLDGLTREEVATLLGPPDSTSEFISLKRDLAYYLGPERGFMSVDNEWLLIWLKNGRVDHYEVMTD